MNTHFLLPPAARGALFEKSAPLDPPQKLLIKGGHGLQPGRILMQTMTAFTSFLRRRLIKRLKASIHLLAIIFFVCNFGHCNLEFVCNLYFVICNFFTNRSATIHAMGFL